MALHFHGKAKWLAGCLSLAVLLTGCGRPQDTHGKGKTIRAAQSGMADIIGDDNAALQKGSGPVAGGRSTGNRARHIYHEQQSLHPIRRDGARDSRSNHPEEK